MVSVCYLFSPGLHVCSSMVANKLGLMSGTLAWPPSTCPALSFRAGSPIHIPDTSTPGYQTLPGLLLLSQYDLNCPGSIRNGSCRLLGSAQDLAAACDAHPDCQAVVYAPLGRDNLNASQGTLKGTPGNRSASLDLTRANWSPRVQLLVREGVPVILPQPGADASHRSVTRRPAQPAVVGAAEGACQVGP